MFPEPLLTHRSEAGANVPLLVWRLPEPVRAISSAVLGGGIGLCAWLINASVPMSYDRPDPAAHLAEIAAGLGLKGPGVGLLTGVDVADVVPTEETGVRLWATVGLGAPIRAASTTASTTSSVTNPLTSVINPLKSASASTTSAPDSSAAAASAGTSAGTSGSAAASASASTSSAAPDEAPPRPGTVNVIAWMPQRLSDGALVNAVATITEAKTQALTDLGLDATGTATDAICVLCPLDGPIAAYGGPRSRWGEPLARAAHRAVLDGGAINLSGPQSWSDRQSRR